MASKKNRYGTKPLKFSKLDLSKAERMGGGLLKDSSFKPRKSKLVNRFTKKRATKTVLGML